MRIPFTSRHIGGHHLILVGGLLFLSSFFTFGHVDAVSRDPAHDGRLVTFHDRGTERVILTRAQTVKDALDAAHISVVSEDTVEPSEDTQLIANDYTINIYRARPVVVVDGALREKIMTAAQTPEAIAAAADVKLHDEDKATVGASSDIISDGASVTLTIDRATEFTLNQYGTITTAYTRAKTVGDMLKSKGIKLAANDTLSAASSSQLSSGMTVAIFRNGVQTATVEEPIAFTTRQIQDVDQPVGYKQVQAAGTNGKKNVTYQITMQNGKEVGRTVIQSVTTEEPREQVEVVGTKVNLPAGSHEDWMAAAGIAASDYGYVNYIVSHEGGWEPCKVQGGAINCAYAGSMGYGVVQATPGSKMASAGSDWRTNPITQLRWATGYAVGRYGSWNGAYNHWLGSHSW